MPTNERPLDVRRRRTDLRARVNGDLPLEFGDAALTSYAGLALFCQYLRATGFNQIARSACAEVGGHGDFGAVALIRVLIGFCSSWAGGGCDTSPLSRTIRSCSGSARCGCCPPRGR